MSVEDQQKIQNEMEKKMFIFGFLVKNKSVSYYSKEIKFVYDGFAFGPFDGLEYLEECLEIYDIYYYDRYDGMFFFGHKIDSDKNIKDDFLTDFYKYCIFNDCHESERNFKPQYDEILKFPVNLRKHYVDGLLFCKWLDSMKELDENDKCMISKIIEGINDKQGNPFTIELFI